jgi:hypothetical protein
MSYQPFGQVGAGKARDTGQKGAHA